MTSYLSLNKFDSSLFFSVGFGSAEAPSLTYDIVEFLAQLCAIPSTYSDPMAPVLVQSTVLALLPLLDHRPDHSPCDQYLSVSFGNTEAYSPIRMILSSSWQSLAAPILFQYYLCLWEPILM